MVARSFLALGVDAIQEGRARLTHNGACERSMHASFRILLFGLGCKDTSYPSPKPLTFAGSTFSALCCCSFFFLFSKLLPSEMDVILVWAWMLQEWDALDHGHGRHSGLGMDDPRIGYSRPLRLLWFGHGYSRKWCGHGCSRHPKSATPVKFRHCWAEPATCQEPEVERSPPRVFPA